MRHFQPGIPVLRLSFAPGSRKSGTLDRTIWPGLVETVRSLPFNRVDAAHREKIMATAIPGCHARDGILFGRSRNEWQCARRLPIERTRSPSCAAALAWLALSSEDVLVRLPWDCPVERIVAVASMLERARRSFPARRGSCWRRRPRTFAAATRVRTMHPHEGGSSAIRDCASAGARGEIPAGPGSPLRNTRCRGARGHAATSGGSDAVFVGGHNGTGRKKPAGLRYRSPVARIGHSVHDNWTEGVPLSCAG